jgi:hypothetical protein
MCLVEFFIIRNTSRLGHPCTLATWSPLVEPLISQQSVRRGCHALVSFGSAQESCQNS